MWFWCNSKCKLDGSAGQFLRRWLLVYRSRCCGCGTASSGYLVESTFSSRNASFTSCEAGTHTLLAAAAFTLALTRCATSVPACGLYCSARTSPYCRTLAQQVTLGLSITARCYLAFKWSLCCTTPSWDRVLISDSQRHIFSFVVYSTLFLTGYVFRCLWGIYMVCLLTKFGVVWFERKVGHFSLNGR